jgi:phage tail sheath gpL-like
MTISHTIPSTVRRPGNFHIQDLTSSAQALTPLPNRVLLIGTMNPTGASAVADAFVQINSEADADGFFGIGSELALMCRKALAVGRSIGFQPEIWASPIAEAAGGTQCLNTITVTAGSAAVAGDIVFQIGEKLFRAGVSAGDDQDAVAAAIKLAVDTALETVPVAPSVVTNVVTLTNHAKSINGSDLKVLILDVGLTGLVITPAQSVAGVGSPDHAGALSASLAKFFESIVLANHAAGDVTALKTHLDLAWAPSEKRWAFGFIGENGTLGTANALAIAANDERVCFGTYEDSPSMPGLIATEMATMVGARELANYNWDHHESLLAVPPDASAYTAAELGVALAAGTTPFVPNDARDGSELVRLITSKTTEGGNPFERVKDLATMRGLVYTTRQLDTAFSQKFKAVNKSAQVLKRMRSVAFEVLDALEDLGVTQNVDELFPQLIVESDPLVPTRAVVSIPESIIPNLHQIVLKAVLFTE